MRCLPHLLCHTVLAPLCIIAGSSGVGWAADLTPPPPAPVLAAPVPPGWPYRFVPYGWLTSVDGTQTVRGRSVKVDASFIDIVEKSDTLVALMGTFEARNGPFALYGDLSGARSGWREAMSGLVR